MVKLVSSSLRSSRQRILGASLICARAHLVIRRSLFAARLQSRAQSHLGSRWAVWTPRNYLLATTPLTRSQNDSGLEIGTTAFRAEIRGTRGTPDCWFCAREERAGTRGAAWVACLPIREPLPSRRLLLQAPFHSSHISPPSIMILSVFSTSCDQRTRHGSHPDRKSVV